MKKQTQVLGVQADPPRLTWVALAVIAGGLSIPVFILLEVMF